MRVRFTDPQGPRRSRMVPYALPLLLMLVAFSGAIHGASATFVGALSVAVFNLIGLLPSRRGRPREAELVCGPGRVEITKAGGQNQRIRAKDVVGATTSRTRDGLSITIQHKKRRQPITVEVSDETHAEAIRHALGVGHGGFGTVAWSTVADSTASAAIVGRLIATLLALLTMGLALLTEEGAQLAAVGLSQFIVLGSVLGLMGLFAKSAQPTVLMGADGLRLKTPKGWFALPYEAIERIEAIRRGFVFHVPAPYFNVSVERTSALIGGVSDHEGHVMVSQITAAAQRARGLGPLKNDVTGRLDVLRRQGESPRDWLVRLDMAGQLLSSGSGYRGNTLDANDLWTILEDPEAEPDLRAAAARVLRHQAKPETRIRIDAAVAAVRDASASRRLRIAIQDDLDNASEELAILDANEPRPRAMHAPPHATHRPM